MDYVLISKDQSEALAHRSHLYTKREWRNGRWVYYYEKGSGTMPISGRKYTIYEAKDSKHKKMKRTYGKDGKALTERLAYKMYDTLDFKKYHNDLEKKDWERYSKEKYVQHDPELSNMAKRQLAARKQEESRLNEQERNKKFSKRAAKWMKQRKARLQQAKNKAFTTKHTMKDPKTGKVIKSWETPGWKKK